MGVEIRMGIEIRMGFGWGEIRGTAYRLWNGRVWRGTGLLPQPMRAIGQLMFTHPFYEQSIEPNGKMGG